MKTKRNVFIILLIVLCTIAGKVTEAQNCHSAYFNNYSNADLLSSVMVSSTTGVNYMIGTDSDNNLFIAEMQNNLPTSPVSWAKFFEIPTAISSVCGEIYLTGGVIYPNNGEIFVYGYEGNNNTGIFAVIKMTNGSPTNLSMRFIAYQGSPLYNTPIRDACWANPPGPTGTAYGIVCNGALIRVLNSGVSISGAKSIPDYIITSVVYDADQNKFVVSITENTANPYSLKQGIASIDNNFLFVGNNFNIHLLTITSNNAMLNNFTSKVILEGNGYYYTQDAYLIHDIRGNTGTDGLWFTKINYLTGVVSDYQAYISDSCKVMVVDAADNFVNLYILHTTVKLGLIDRRSILQVDLYDFSNYKWQQSNDVQLPNYSYQPYLSNMIYNHAHYDVVSTGSYDGQTYLLETIDLFANTCDTDIGSYLQEITFNVSSDTNSINKSFNVNGGSTSTIYDYSITHSTLCCDFFPLESIMQRKNEIQEIINSKKQEYKLKSTPKPDSNKPEIKVLEKSFKCTNAEGVCKYTIYNSMGIIIDQGITNNNAEIMLPKLISGTYIIKLIDENYKETSKKIIINEIY